MKDEQVAAIVQAIVFHAWLSQPGSDLEKGEVIDSWFDFISEWERKDKE